MRKPGKSTDKTSRENAMMTSEPKFQEHKKLKPANNKIQSYTIPNVNHQTNRSEKVKKMNKICFANISTNRY